MKYNHKAVEEKWQKIWEDKGVFHASEDTEKEKFYALIEFPYPSGQGLHVGHPRPYTALDTVARKRRLEGYSRSVFLLTGAEKSIRQIPNTTSGHSGFLFSSISTVLLIKKR